MPLTAYQKMKYDVIVGLPAKNEEAGIFEALESISEAVKYAKIKNYKVVVCVNGCVDNTAERVKEFIDRNSDVSCELIKSLPGLVNAQRKIAEHYPSEIYVFPDADGKIAKNSIKLLLDELYQNPRLIVAYAKTVSLRQSTDKMALSKKIGLLYDSQKLLTPRKYFHGRLFAIRDWHIPQNSEIKKLALFGRYNKEMLKYCSDKILLSADDVFMSSYIMDRYGLNAIKQVDKAHCYNWPVSSFIDWFNVYRRRNIEMEKMRRWFPQYNYLWSHLNRHTDWNKWLKTDWPDKVIWLSYLLMKGILFCYLRFEFWLLKFDFYRPPAQWKTTDSTKKRVNRIFFFDIDDTIVGSEIKSLDKLKKEIFKFKKLGDVFGLNTNRPWPEAADIYSSLSLNGPIICEGGSYYKLNPQSKEKKSPLADCRLKKVIINFIKRSYNRHKISLVVSDDKRILHGHEPRNLIFITAGRKFSASIYARNHNRNSEFVDSLYKTLKKKFKKIDFNLLAKEGKITANNSLMNKFSTASSVLNRHFKDYRAYHISNHEEIKTNWSKIKFCGIMKADRKYKNKCFYVADKAGEEGIIQIINNCL